MSEYVSNEHERGENEAFVILCRLEDYAGICYNTNTKNCLRCAEHQKFLQGLTEMRGRLNPANNPPAPTVTPMFAVDAPAAPALARVSADFPPGLVTRLTRFPTAQEFEDFQAGRFPIYPFYFMASQQRRLQIGQGAPGQYPPYRHPEYLTQATSARGPDTQPAQGPAQATTSRSAIPGNVSGKTSRSPSPLSGGEGGGKRIKREREDMPPPPPPGSGAGSRA